MSGSYFWNNLLMYSLQIGLLVGLAAFVPALLRLRSPGARLLYLQVLLAACLLLPLAQPWKRNTGDGNIEITTTFVAAAPVAPRSGPSVPWSQFGLFVLAAGMAVRLAALALGFRRLSIYRRNAHRLDHTGTGEAFLSDEISSPVTFGFRKPVVLLPAGFPGMDPGRQQAILCHEFLHVERGDWLMIVAEEVVRAIFWFHPAVWWVLGEIQLAREQAVDHEVVKRTQARDEYVDALLEIAGARLQPELAPAPLFLRRRHLKQRVISIFQEVPMSKTRLISRLALGLAILVTAGWLVTDTFPLAASPQSGNDAPGVTVDIGGATLMHRTPVTYPEAARKKGIQGTVMVEATLDARGNVSDARVVSGPDELRRAALDSVLQWHFANGSAGATRQVTIGFKLEGVVGGTLSSVPAPPARLIGRTVKSINIVGLSDEARSQLTSILPVHVGDTLSADLIKKLQEAVTGFDEHLKVGVGTTGQDEASVQISVPGAPSAVPSRIKIGGAVQQAKLIRQPHPIYPPDAKAQRIQGVVQLSAVIGKDGTIQSLEVISGHPLLVQSALDAVRQWVYQTTLLNGEPVEVVTQIDVNYTLSQ